MTTTWIGKNRSYTKEQSNFQSMEVYPKARQQWAVSTKDPCLALSFAWSAWMTFLIFYKEICFLLLMTLSWFLRERILMTSNATFNAQRTGLRLGTSLWTRTRVATSLSDLLPPVTWHFQIMGISIKLLDSTNGLRIIIGSSFKQSLHCAQAYKRARAALFLIRRSFVTLAPEILIPPYALILNTPSKFEPLPRYRSFGTSSTTSCLNGQRLSGSFLRGKTWKAKFIFLCTSKTERWFDPCL